MSTIIGGVIIFAIIFSTIATYFTFTEQATNQRALLNAQAASEVFAVSGTISTTNTNCPGGASNNLCAVITDNGATSISIVSLIVTCESTTCGTATVNQILASTNLNPAEGVNPGQISSPISTGYAYPTTNPSPQISIKAVSSLGTVESVLYPVNPTNALVAGTVGDLLLNFGSYSYYTVTGSTPSGANSGYSLSNPSGCTLTGSTGTCSASIIPSTPTTVLSSPNSDDIGCGDYDSDDPNGLCQATPIAFSVQVTDLNPNQESIVLSQFTVLYQAPTALSAQESGETPAPFVPWYIVNVVGGQIQNQYTPIVLTYNVPTTIYFASNNCVGGASGLPNPALSNCGTLSYSSTLGVSNQIQVPISPSGK